MQRVMLDCRALLGSPDQMEFQEPQEHLVWLEYLVHLEIWGLLAFQGRLAFLEPLVCLVMVEIVVTQD